MTSVVNKFYPYVRAAFVLTVVFVMFVTTGTAQVFALTQSDRDNLYTPFYDPDSRDSLCSGNFSGSSNVEVSYNYLRSQDLTHAQASGVVGNLMVESGPSIDPTVVSGAGYRGIAQWDKNSRWPALVAWASQNHKDELELETQLEYMVFEATGRGNIDGLKAYDDVEHTTWYWGRFFEGAVIDGNLSTEPLTNVQLLAQRTEYAAMVFGEYSDSTASSATSCTGVLGDIECPATMEAHPTRSGYYKLPDAPNEEYTIYSLQDRRYGSQELVCAIYSVALAYNESMAGRSRLRIGDLNASGHRSHRWGVAVDLSAFGEIQAASHNKPWKGAYSPEATVLLGKLFIDTKLLRNIWWCPPAGDDSIEQLLSYAQESQEGLEGQIKCISGHADHFHVDIKAEHRLSVWEP